MANEITVTTQLKLSNGTVLVSPGSVSASFDQSTARGGNPGFVNIGTTEETISFGDVTAGWVQMINHDTTNYVEVGSATGEYLIRLPASKGMALFYINTGKTLYVKANTGACDVEIIGLST